MMGSAIIEGGWLMQMIDLMRKLIEIKGSDLHLMAGLHPAIRVYGERKGPR